ncbi:MAG: N-acetylmuramoyl-L-alanine amidase [Firmicutes bacterium]|nr:N-acetylmuramoyl-L-alanine amidase [Bacillota bacterium]
MSTKNSKINKTNKYEKNVDKYVEIVNKSTPYPQRAFKFLYRATALVLLASIISGFVFMALGQYVLEHSRKGQEASIQEQNLLEQNNLQQKLLEIKQEHNLLNQNINCSPPNRQANASTANETPQFKTIVIDAGHGGRDAGVRGEITDVAESDLNLQVTFALRDELKQRGHTVVLTRQTKGHLSKTDRFVKREDMEARETTIQNNAHDFVISIHMNRFSDSKRRGAQVFYQKGSDNTLAKYMQNALNQNQEKKTQAIAGDFFILRASKKPSIIIECGFLSNPTDEKQLACPDHQKQLAKTIANGLEEFLKIST